MGSVGGAWGSCEPASVRLSVEITPELIDRIVRHLERSDDPDDPYRVWQGLRFMEANGIDLSLGYDQIHGWLTSENSPLPDADSLTLDEERRIVLQLRQRLRSELGLPLRTADEQRHWRLDPPERRIWRPDQLHETTNTDYLRR